MHPSRCAGLVATACTQGKRTQHGKPRSGVSDDQPHARERRSGRHGVRERLVVPRKTGNAGGGKGPQFRTNARRSEGQEIGQPINSEKCSEAADGVTRESEDRSRVPLLRAVRQDLPWRHPGACLCAVPLEQGHPAVLVLDPIFEADLPPEQYAYRQGRNAQQAVIDVEKTLFYDHPEVVDADLADYFGSIPHSELMCSLARRIADGRVLHLIKMWLECAVEDTDDKGRKRRTTEAKVSGHGIPQGSPLSPLLANVYMRRFVLGWKKLGLEQRLGTRIVIYADDLVILCRAD
jgi:Reverse transcriptase (RNA-dependent DNA polymerase)